MRKECLQSGLRGSEALHAQPLRIQAPPDGASATAGSAWPCVEAVAEFVARAWSIWGGGGSAVRMLHPVSKRHDPEPEKSIEALRSTAVKPSCWSCRDVIGLYTGAYKYRCDGDRSAELAQGLLQRLRMIVCKPRYRQTLRDLQAQKASATRPDRSDAPCSCDEKALRCD